MLRLSYLIEAVLSNKITRNRIVLSFKDSPRKPLGRRPKKQKLRLKCSVKTEVSPAGVSLVPPAGASAEDSLAMILNLRQ